MGCGAPASRAGDLGTLEFRRLTRVPYNPFQRVTHAIASRHEKPDTRNAKRIP